MNTVIQWQTHAIYSSSPPDFIVPSPPKSQFNTLSINILYFNLQPNRSHFRTQRCSSIIMKSNAYPSVTVELRFSFISPRPCFIATASSVFSSRRTSNFPLSTSFHANSEIKVTSKSSSLLR